MIAMNFWGDRHVNVPCTPVAVPGADAQMPKYRFGITDVWTVSAMAADAQGCRILISEYGAMVRSIDPALYCADVVHEVGHIAGLEHRDDGVMNAQLDENRIWDCAHWKAYAKRHGFPLGRRYRP